VGPDPYPASKNNADPDHQPSLALSMNETYSFLHFGDSKFGSFFENKFGSFFENSSDFPENESFV
jgi:hypothetical protein